MKKKIEIIVALLSLLIGVPGIWFSYEQYKHERGGEMRAFFNSQLIDDSVNPRSVVVCLDDEHAEMPNLQLAPVFNNTSQYTIKDFDLQHTVEADGVVAVPNGFYTKTRYNATKDVFSYNNDKIAAFSQTPYPFESFELDRGGGSCVITTHAAYDGAERPFEFETNLVFKVISSEGKSFDEWKLACDERLSRMNMPEQTDIFYSAQGRLAYANAVALAAETEPELALEVEGYEAEPAKEVAPVKFGSLEITDYSYDRADSVATLYFSPVAQNLSGVLYFSSADDWDWTFFNINLGDSGLKASRIVLDGNLESVQVVYPDSELAVKITKEANGSKIENRGRVPVVLYDGNTAYLIKAKSWRRVNLASDDALQTFSLPDTRTKFQRIIEMDSWLAYILLFLVSLGVGMLYIFIEDLIKKEGDAWIGGVAFAIVAAIAAVVYYFI